jgi:hypothetical protein
LLRGERQFEVQGIKPHEDLTLLDPLSDIDGSFEDLSADSEAKVALHAGFHDPGEGPAIRAGGFRLDNLHRPGLEARIVLRRL